MNLSSDERQEAHEAGVLDGEGQLALVLHAGAGFLARNDASIRIEELFEEFDVFVVDMLDVIRREITLLFLFLIHDNVELKRNIF